MLYPATKQQITVNLTRLLHDSAIVLVMHGVYVKANTPYRKEDALALRSADAMAILAILRSPHPGTAVPVFSLAADTGAKPHTVRRHLRTLCQAGQAQRVPRQYGEPGGYRAINTPVEK